MADDPSRTPPDHNAPDHTVLAGEDDGAALDPGGEDAQGAGGGEHDEHDEHDEPDEHHEPGEHGVLERMRGAGVGVEDPNIVGDVGPTDVAPGRDPEPLLVEADDGEDPHAVV